MENFFMNNQVLKKMDLYGSCWNLIRLDSSCVGKKILIEFGTDPNNSLGIIESIFYGSKSSILFNIFNQNKGKLIICILILIFSFGLFFCSFLARKTSEFEG